MGFIRHASAGAGPLALMLALASGSVWSVVTQWTESPAGWMAVPVALLIASAPLQLGLVARTAASRNRASHLALNFSMLLLATLYAQYLGAAAVVSREMGFDFLRTLREIGPALALTLARERAGPLDWAGIGLALTALIGCASVRPRSARA